MTYLVRIDGKCFGVVASSEISGLRRQVVDRVRSGGGFVTIPSAGQGSVDVLVGPHTSVVVEESRVDDRDSTSYVGDFVAADDRVGEPVLDYDMYGLDLLPV